MPKLPDLKAHPALALAREHGMAERRAVGGLFGSARALALAALATERPVIAMVKDLAEAEGLEDDLENLAPATGRLLLRPVLGTEDDREGLADVSERLAQLRALEQLGAGTVVLLPVSALLEALPSTSEVSERSLRLAVGDRVEPAAIREQLFHAGFRSVPLVGAPAEIAMRGDIVDVYPLGAPLPLRIELFDDAIESIRAFDPETQLSVESRTEVVVPLVKPDELLGGGRCDRQLDELLPSGALLAWPEPEKLKDKLEEAAFAHEIDKVRVRRARAFLEQAPGVELHVPQLDGPKTGNVPVLSVQGVGGGVDGLADSVRSLRQRASRVVVLVESDGELRRLNKLLAEKELAGPDLEVKKGRVRQGFQLGDARVAILNHLELLGKPRLWRPKPKKPAVPARAITNLLELHSGDYVVHQTHGVARFQGMVRRKREQGEEDFLVLEFDGGTLFYLQASKIDLVQRFVGTSGAAPRLDKIGGRSWSNKKARVKAALEELAHELLEVQAARELRTGAAHPYDEALIADFESSFPFTDTKDQASAMVEIHRDLDADRPMDRLLCGDVGFGKTELAIRAAFRVVCGGRQVAVLVPTTLLAEQHFRTFERRFANYPIKVAVLSRFRTKAELAAAVEGLKSGQIDVAIGTHRLISKDVGFKDLGLVVVDEEQRFGVKAKEALKKLKRAVDVLTLTATPIPRTLHMALTGLRDISSLTTPPPGRKPVKTELHRFHDAFVRRAVLAELDRAGQVFFVHNRVATLDRTAQRIAALVPMARVVVAHGQMEGGELDAAVESFAAGEADVLTSTNIVESGLDLPRANTILIDHPDHFGLADLHQLRGRVGRGEAQAFCYLLVPDKPLPSDAERRLKAIEEMSHLGAGYDLSIKDLEIRGAGNLLSASQHGHIAAVGYDLYVQLLRQAVSRQSGKPAPALPRETDVDLGLEAFLPAEYVPDPGQRMELLRRLGGEDARTVAQLAEEMRDRFGRLPKVVKNLLEVFEIKRRCQALSIRRLIYPGDDHVLLEPQDAALFRRRHPFQKHEIAELSTGIFHLRLPERSRSPEAALRWLSERLVKPQPGTRSPTEPIQKDRR